MPYFLPIGSVVRLKHIDTPIMIFGYLQQSAAIPNKVVDYIGVPYPCGNKSFDSQIGFSIDNIEELLFEGYKTTAFDNIRMLLNLKYDLDNAAKKAKEMKNNNSSAAAAGTKD